MNRFAIRVQFWLLMPLPGKAMQVDADAQFMQGFDLVKQIIHAAEIRGPGYIVGYYV